MECTTLLIVGVLSLLPAGSALAIGEKYADQGARLGRAIDKHLIDQKICMSGGQDCNRKLPMYGGHGNKINFSIYAPDKQALAAMVAYLIEHGMEVTGGVPISITVYPKTREAYASLLFSSPDPSITFKIDK